MARLGSAVPPSQFHLLVLFILRDFPVVSPTAERTLEEGFFTEGKALQAQGGLWRTEERLSWPAGRAYAS